MYLLGHRVPKLAQLYFSFFESPVNSKKTIKNQNILDELKLGSNDYLNTAGFRIRIDLIRIRNTINVNDYWHALSINKFSFIC
jgi:hypothetical protein